MRFAIQAITITVSDLSRSKQFYEGTLGFEPDDYYEPTRWQSYHSAGRAFLGIAEVESLHAPNIGDIINFDVDCRVADSMQREANRIIASTWDNIRDFLAVHYCFNHHRDTPFWQHCREATDLAGAEPLVDFYRDSGPSPMMNKLVPRDAIFPSSEFLIMFIGQRVKTNYSFEPDEADRQNWEQVRARTWQVAEHAYTMDDGLALIDDPGWNWATM